MNLDRYAMNGGQQVRQPKFVLPRHGDIYRQASQFLDHVYIERDFCYKDVVQPFVVSAWLKAGPSRPVLKIKPNIAHVAYSMLQRQWLYPTVVSRRSESSAAMMVEGLLIAQTVLSAVPGEEIAYDDLLDDPTCLERALVRLYPDEHVGPVIWPEDFERRRDEVLSRREHDLFRQLDALAGDMLGTHV